MAGRLSHIRTLLAALEFFGCWLLCSCSDRVVSVATRQNVTPLFWIRVAQHDPGSFKYGFIDATGAVRIPAEFDEVKDFQEGYASVKREGKWGIIDETGGWLIPPRYASVSGYSEGRCAVYTDEKAGFVDYEGKEVIPPKFRMVGDFHGGLAPAALRDTRLREKEWFPRELRWGYIRPDGGYQIKPSDELIFAGNFNGDIAVVGYIAPYATGPVPYLMNRKGKMIPVPDYVPQGETKEPNRFGGGLIKVRDDARSKGWNFIDAGGVVRLKVDFPSCDYFSEGVAGFRSYDGLGGYFDENGRVVIQPTFIEVREFHCGRAFVGIEEATYPGIWTYFEAESGTRYVLEGLKHKLIDRSGSFVAEELFYSPRDFREDRAFARSRMDGGFHLLDLDGKPMSADIIDEVLEDYRDGLSRVMIDGRLTYLDRDGKVVWQEVSNPSDREAGRAE